jgi:hypothetical protein
MGDGLGLASGMADVSSPNGAKRIGRRSAGQG